MIATAFKPGDSVRVKGARRRDIVWTVTEITATGMVRAINEARAAEIVNDPWLLERVDSDAEAEPKPVPEYEERPRSFAAKAIPRVLDSTVIRLARGDDIEWALKRFKKRTQSAAILASLRRHEHYTKPSLARRQKSSAARKRLRTAGS